MSIFEDYVREELQLKGDYLKQEIEELVASAASEFTKKKRLFDPNEFDAENGFVLKVPGIREDLSRHPPWRKHYFAFGLLVLLP